MSDGIVTAAPTATAAPAAGADNTPSQPQGSNPSPAPILTDGVGQNASPSWLDSLPPELKADPNISKFNDPASMAKSWLEAQKLIGKKAVEMPSDNWKPEQWNELFDKLGRPKSPADYKFDSSVIPDGRRDEEMEKYFADKMHKSGLTQKQAEEIHKEFIGYQTSREQAQQGIIAKQNEESMNLLRQEWGDSFNAKADAAFRAAKEFGGQELSEVLSKTGLGNHPTFVKMFAKIGETISEDVARGRSSNESFVASPTSALSEIGALKQDTGFLDAFNNPRNPGHKEAVQRWNKLHEKAYSVSSPI